MQSKDIVIFAPVFNEEENLKKLILSFASSDLRGRISKFIFVDDGSTDQSFSLLDSFRETLDMVIVRHGSNKGIAASFESGFKEVLERRREEEKILVTIEADNTSDINILSDLIRAVEASDTKCALASCYQSGGGVRGTGIHRVLLSKIANILISIRFPDIKVKTYSSFYRAYQIDLLQKIVDGVGFPLFRERGFVSMVEMLILCRNYSAQFVEIPMVLDTSKRAGSSKMRIARTSLAYIRLMLRRF